MHESDSFTIKPYDKEFYQISHATILVLVLDDIEILPI